MNEEEKKAIKWLKELYDIEKDFNSSAGKEESNIIKTLLNLIERQQKEIKELNDFIKENLPVIPFIPEDFKNGDDFADLVTLKNKEYISKDKIIEKIKDLDTAIDKKELMKIGVRQYGSTQETIIQNMIRAKVEILKELLGE